MNEKEKQAIERLERGTTDSYVIIKKDVRILLNLLEKQQAEIESLEQEKQEAWEEWNNIDNYCEQEKQKYKAKIEKKDNAVRNIVQRLENDIKNITKTKADGKHSDYYSRNRLKAYKTKTKEIKEYIEKQYFNQKIEKGE